MNEEMRKLLINERKNKRELAELRAFRQKCSQLVNPDKVMLKAIDDEIARLTGSSK